MKKNKVAYLMVAPYMIIFSIFGVLAFLFSLWLKAEDSRKGYGLEKPNVEKK